MNRVTGGLSNVLRAWKQHRGSLAISFAVTLAALLIYVTTFVGEGSKPLFGFISRLELNKLDTRFQLRGRVHPDPRIIIVDIDQHSQEILWRSPFSRLYFPRMLATLRRDGALV